MPIVRQIQPVPDYVNFQREEESQALKKKRDLEPGHDTILMIGQRNIENSGSIDIRIEVLTNTLTMVVKVHAWIHRRIAITPA